MRPQKLPARNRKTRDHQPIFIIGKLEGSVKPDAALGLLESLFSPIGQ